MPGRERAAWPEGSRAEPPSQQHVPLASAEERARAYIERVQELVCAPIDIISTGPDRNETIVLRHPFA